MLFAVGAVAVLVLVNKAKAGAAAVGQAVNPINRDNIVNRGFSAIYDVFTDGKGTLGTDLYELIHGSG